MLTRDQKKRIDRGENVVLSEDQVEPLQLHEELPKTKEVITEHIDRAFHNCEHPYANESLSNDMQWCNLCGAMRFKSVDGDTRWIHPHRGSAIRRGLDRLFDV